MLVSVRDRIVFEPNALLQRMRLEQDKATSLWNSSSIILVTIRLIYQLLVMSFSRWQEFYGYPSTNIVQNQGPLDFTSVPFPRLTCSAILRFDIYGLFKPFYVQRLVKVKVKSSQFWNRLPTGSWTNSIKLVLEDSGHHHHHRQLN